MDRMITANIGGTPRPLNYSIEVMFNMREKYGTVDAALNIIAQDNMTAFEAVRWFAIQMANDAELCRRDAGYDHSPMLTDAAITPRLSPLDYEELRGAVVQAISLGYRRENSDDEEKETDLGLAELQTKKAEAGA